MIAPMGARTEGDGAERREDRRGSRHERVDGAASGWRRVISPPGVDCYVVTRRERQGNSGGEEIRAANFLAALIF